MAKIIIIQLQTKPLYRSMHSSYLMLKDPDRVARGVKWRQIGQYVG